MSHLLEVEGFLVDRNPVHKFHKFPRNAGCFSVFLFILLESSLS